MRILFVTNRWPSEDSPGDSPALENQAEAIRSEGHIVDVLHFDTSTSRLNYLWGALRLVWSGAIRGRYDLVHAHYGHLVGWVARLQWRSPVVVTYRGSDLLWEREFRLSRALSRAVDAVIVMTDAMRDLLQMPDAAVIPYGIDTSVFKPGSREAARRSLGLPLDAPLVLFPFDASRGIKRFDVAESAMELVRDELEHAELVSISREPPERVASFMVACDALVLTSGREGSPVSVREAAACELPVVSVDVGDVGEIIEGHDHCFIVERSPEQIAAKLLEVLRERPRCKAPTGGSVLSAQAAANDVLDVYARVIEASARRKAAGRSGRRRWRAEQLIENVEDVS